MLIIPSIIVSVSGDGFDITVGALDAPTDFNLTLTPSVTIQITWVKNSAADTTMIRRKPDSYPTGLTDGTEVYNSTGESYIDGDVTSGNDYYYKAWSFNITYNLFSTTFAQDHIYLEAPALFDIKNIFILDSVVPTLSIVCTVENTGDVAADITVTWILIRVDTGATLDTGSDTFAVAGDSEELYYIVPSTTYIGLCRITFSGENASASQLFYTEETMAGPPGPPGPGGRAPSARDSDGDGLTDAEEEWYGTDPNNPDTDGDGYSDYKEIMEGTDPLDPNSYPAIDRAIIFVLIFIVGFIFIVFLIYFFINRKKEKKQQYKRRTTKTKSASNRN